MSATERYRRSSVLDSQRNNIVGANDHDLRIGARVQVQGKIGTIRYAGTTSFQTGKWIGIELDEPTGKNSGVVQGKRYFDCRLNHGVFVRPSQVKLLPSTPSTSSTTSEVRISFFFYLETYISLWGGESQFLPSFVSCYLGWWHDLACFCFQYRSFCATTGPRTRGRSFCPATHPVTIFDFASFSYFLA